MWKFSECLSHKKTPKPKTAGFAKFNCFTSFVILLRSFVYHSTIIYLPRYRDVIQANDSSKLWTESKCSDLSIAVSNETQCSPSFAAPMDSPHFRPSSRNAPRELISEKFKGGIAFRLTFNLQQPECIRVIRLSRTAETSLVIVHQTLRDRGANVSRKICRRSIVLSEDRGFAARSRLYSHASRNSTFSLENLCLRGDGFLADLSGSRSFRNDTRRLRSWSRRGSESWGYSVKRILGSPRGRRPCLDAKVALEGRRENGTRMFSV